MLFLSPTKKMNLQNSIKNDSNIFFKEESELLRSKISSLSKEDLAHVMKIKNKVLDNTYNYYKSKDHYLSYRLYDGIAFKELNTLDTSFERLNDIYILSALYGIVKACDKIKPYRLDFTMSSKLKINLYELWSDNVTDLIKKINPPFILDLSSDEFSKLLNNLKNKNYYTVTFDKKYNSTFLKKARGHLAYLYVTKQVNNIEDYRYVCNDFIKSIKINNNLLEVSLQEGKI